MSKSNAERQRAYRQRHLHDIDRSAAQLNMLVDIHAKRQLERLASHYGVTQRAMLERLLGETESNLVDSLTGAQRITYLDGQ